MKIMKEQTYIQKQIERVVTSRRGYDRKNTERTPDSLRNTEIGVQIALVNMETCDGKLDIEEVVGFSPRLETMIKKFRNARIPLEVITDANGFRKAFSSAYDNPNTTDRPDAITSSTIREMKRLGNNPTPFEEKILADEGRGYFSRVTEVVLYRI